MHAGPNPAHVVNIDFFWIWPWLLHVVQLVAKHAAQVDLLLDAHDLEATLGCNGRSLARKLLSDPVWLPQEQLPLVISLRCVASVKLPQQSYDLAQSVSLLRIVKVFHAGAKPRPSMQALPPGELRSKANHQTDYCD